MIGGNKRSISIIGGNKRSISRRNILRMEFVIAKCYLLLENDDLHWCVNCVAS